MGAPGRSAARRIFHLIRPRIDAHGKSRTAHSARGVRRKAPSTPFPLVSCALRVVSSPSALSEREHNSHGHMAPRSTRYRLVCAITYHGTQSHAGTALACALDHENSFTPFSRRPSGMTYRYTAASAIRWLKHSDAFLRPIRLISTRVPLSERLSPSSPTAHELSSMDSRLAFLKSARALLGSRARLVRESGDAEQGNSPGAAAVSDGERDSPAAAPADPEGRVRVHRARDHELTLGIPKERSHRIAVSVDFLSLPVPNEPAAHGHAQSPRRTSARHARQSSRSAAAADREAHSTASPRRNRGQLARMPTARLMNLMDAEPDSDRAAFGATGAAGETDRGRPLQLPCAARMSRCTCRC
jgi:hypothetical protein